MARAEGLPLRISYYLFAQKPGQELKDYEAWIQGERPGTNSDAHHDEGFVLEGAGENLVWSAGDFENFRADRPDLDANPKWRDELTAVVRTLVRKRWPIRIHATYDETIVRILSVFEAVDREEKAAGRPGFTGLRWAMDHVETIKPAQIARIKALGGGVMIQDRMAFAGEDFIKRYGAEAASHAPPITALLAAGIPVGARHRRHARGELQPLAFAVLDGVGQERRRHATDVEDKIASIARRRCSCTPSAARGSAARKTSRVASHPASTPTWHC